MQAQLLIGKKQPSFEGIENLGYLNSWGENIPIKVYQCWNSDHKRENHKTGKWEKLIICRQCNYLYKVDSSD